MAAIHHAAAAGIIATMLSHAAYAQALQPSWTSDRPSEALKSALGCPRPADAKDAKVVDFDTTTRVARLAVNLGNGRFKLVTINPADRGSDPRPLAPVLEAARIVQGTVQFYAPDQSADPESTHDKFVMVVEMGAGNVCWATPGALLEDGAYPVAGTQGTPATTASASAARAPAAASPAPAPQAVESAPPAENAADRAPRGRRSLREGR